MNDAYGWDIMGGKCRSMFGCTGSGHHPHVLKQGFRRPRYIMTCGCGWKTGGFQDEDKALKRFPNHELAIAKMQARQAGVIA